MENRLPIIIIIIIIFHSCAITHVFVYIPMMKLCGPSSLYILWSKYRFYIESIFSNTKYNNTHTYIMSLSLPLIKKSKKNSFSPKITIIASKIQTTQKKYICTLLLLMFLVQFGNKHRNKSIGVETSKKNIIAPIRRGRFV